MISKGTTVRISAHHSEPGQGLTYGAKLATLADDCPEPPGGWDVIDLTDGSSVYAFSVSRVMNREAFKLARDTLRTAVKEYGATRRCEYGCRRGFHFRPGKFEGEHWSIVHWYGAMMDGGGDEPLMSGDDCVADVFELSDVERAAFAVNPGFDFAVLWHSSNGFESFEYVSADGYDKLREQYETEE